MLVGRGRLGQRASEGSSREKLQQMQVSLPLTFMPDGCNTSLRRWRRWYTRSRVSASRPECSTRDLCWEARYYQPITFHSSFRNASTSNWMVFFNNKIIKFYIYCTLKIKKIGNIKKKKNQRHNKRVHNLSPRAVNGHSLQRQSSFVTKHLN